VGGRFPEDFRMDQDQARPWSFDPALSKVALAFSRRFHAPVEDTEDIAQEALLKLVTYGGKIEDPVAWLFVVVRRLHQRQRRSQRPLPPVPTSFDPWPGVELSIDTRRLLGRISPRSRVAVCLSFAGYTEREAADRMGCSVKTTEKSLHRTRRRLRQVFMSG
jgi:DNA-directed RNA polymerase specialized sigma24 family protein